MRRDSQPGHVTMWCARIYVCVFFIYIYAHTHVDVQRRAATDTSRDIRLCSRAGARSFPLYVWMRVRVRGMDRRSRASLCLSFDPLVPSFSYPPRFLLPLASRSPSVLLAARPFSLSFCLGLSLCFSPPFFLDPRVPFLPLVLSGRPAFQR